MVVAQKTCAQRSTDYYNCTTELPSRKANLEQNPLTLEEQNATLLHMICMKDIFKKLLIPGTHFKAVPHNSKYW